MSASIPRPSTAGGRASRFVRGSGRGRAWSCLTLVLLALLAGTVFFTITVGAHHRAQAIGGTLAAWAVFLLAAGAARRIPRGHLVPIVLVGAVILGGTGLLAPPSTSNDSARYAWDGIVQEAGVSPYAFVPADVTLRELRPGWLFRPAEADGSCPADVFRTGTVTTTNVPGGNALCTAINRPTVPTIYPPAAELYFVAVRAGLAPGVGFIAFQLAGLLLSLAITVALLAFLRRTGRPGHPAVWWAWSPLVAFEAVNNAHVDTLGAALALAAGILLVRGQVLASGFAFGAAIATKLIPAVSAPALLYRRPARFVLTTLATLIVLYLPYVLVSGPAVAGFLPGYLREEGYDRADSSRFTLLKLVLPAGWSLPVAAVLLLALALWVWRTTDAVRPWSGQVVVLGWALLIASPNYPWYSLLLLPFVVLSGRYEYAAVALALSLVYLTAPAPHAVLLARLALGAAVAVVVAMTLIRRRAVPVRANGTPGCR